MIRPRLRDDLSAEVVGPHLVVLLSDVAHWTLQGPVYPRLVPLLNGTRSVREVVEELRGHVNIAEVHAALMILERSGYLTDGARPLGGPPTRISLVSFGPVSRDTTIGILEALGLSVHADAELTLVLTDEYLRREIAEFALAAERTNRPWLPIKPTGTVVWVGPLVHPPDTPCWSCLLQRVRAMRPAHAWLESRGAPGARAVVAQSLPSVLPLAVHAASTQMRRWAARPKPYESRPRLITIDPTTLRVKHHVVVSQPNCLHCRPGANSGHASATKDGRVVLVRRPKLRKADTGWRALPPGETFRKYRHHISDVTGVVSQLRRRSVGARSLALYTAEHLFVPSADDLFTTGRRISTGKGLSNTQARTSALCEALERYSGVFRGEETRIRASYASLGDAAVHPNACANYSDTQFENREIWNARPSPRSWVPHGLDHRQEVEWTPLWSLTNEIARYVPTSYCYYGYRAAPNEECCRANSNGCAAGNNIEEAILQGFLELAERDAVAVWWYNEIARPTVDLTTFSQPFFREMTDEYERAGCSLRVLDLTTDLAIPVFAAVSDAPNSARHQLLLGFGAHLDAETAISRALTELNQWRCGVDLGVAGPSFSDAGGRPGEFLRDGPAVAIRRRQDFVTVDHDDIRDAVRACVDCAARRGLETLVLDQTREDIGLSVVRVIVPGLRHFWPRLGPGRLYSVPVDLGWLCAAKAEHQLNNSHILI